MEIKTWKYNSMLHGTMNAKTWQCSYMWHDIQFKNEWTVNGYVKEELLIDWKSVFMEEKNIWKDSIKDIVWSKIQHKLDNGVMIEVITWSAWHLCWVAVKILADWHYIWWDKKVLFVKK